MRERRLVIARPVDDGQVAFLPEPVHAHHRPLKAEVIIDLDHVLLTDADRGPVSIQRVVPIRDKGAQPVVAAEPLEHHEDLAGRGGQCFRRRPEQRWQGTHATEQAQTDAAGADLECLPAGHARLVAQLLASFCHGHGQVPVC